MQKNIADCLPDNRHIQTIKLQAMDVKTCISIYMQISIVEHSLTIKTLHFGHI